MALIDNYCTNINPDFTEINEAATYLSDYSVTTRYPGNYFPLTFIDANQAFENAVQIKEYILKMLKD